MLSASVSYWRAVRLVGEHDHVAPVAEQLRRLELVDQREDVAVVARQQLAQFRAGLGVADVRIAHRAAGGEGLGDLLVQLHPVGDDHEGPVARHLAQDLLREEHHRKALARALRLPEDTAAPVPRRPRRQRRADRVVHAEVLMVLRDGFDQPALVLGKEREVLDEIQQPRRLAQPAQHHLQRHPPRLVLALDPLPLGEPIPVRRQRTDPAVRAVGSDQERVVPEQRRDAVLQMLVAREVLVERLLGRHAGLLELDHDQAAARSRNRSDQAGKYKARP